MDFTVKDVLRLIRRYFLLISVCTFAGLSLSFLVNKLMIDKTYTASASFYVSTTDSTLTNLSELDYAQKIAETYINFLNTRQFFLKVIDLSDLPYTMQELQAMTTISTIRNTEIFSITLTSKNPDDSYNLVKSMETVAPQLIKDIKSNVIISVVDPVAYPTSPSGPNTLFNTLLGGIVTGCGVFIFVILKEILNIKVANQEDLLKHYEIPLLGSIPHASGKANYARGIRNSTVFKILAERFGYNETVNTTLNDESKFLVSESYKALRTNLRFSVRKEGCKKILITSPAPEDGKSTTSINLSIVLSQAGNKVLLIDCDLRKGRTHHFFRAKSAPGLSDCLSNMNTTKEVIYTTPYNNLYSIPMGSIPPNPSELLGSRQMEALIKELESEYDYIILDTPPVNVVADSLSFIKNTDGAILVIREGKTSYPEIENVLMKYRYAKANILGFVLNGVSVKEMGINKSKYYYYHRSEGNK